MDKNDKNFLAQKIRSQYTESENTQLDDLKALDIKVKRPAILFGYIFGSAAALILGTGMSLVMEFSERFMTAGIATGILGLILTIITYPLYKKILNNRKKKFATQIIELSNKIID